MGMCDFVSIRSSCDRKHVGAVIVRNNRVLSIGYNGSPAGTIHCNERKCIRCGWVDEETKIPHDKFLPDGDCPKCSTSLWPEKGTVKGGHYIVDGHCLRTVHSEMNAIAHAAKAGVALDGATIYCNTLPCWDCLKLIVSAGIVEAIYKDDYPSKGKGPIQDYLSQLKKTRPAFKLTPFSSLLKKER